MPERLTPEDSNNEHAPALTTNDVSLERVADTTITLEQYRAGARVVAEVTAQAPAPADPSKYRSGPAANLDAADPRLLNNRKSGQHYRLWTERMDG